MITTVEGADFSHWNLEDGEVFDFQVIKNDSDIVFVICKATESTYFKDDKWPYYRDGFHGVGMPLGGYHFYRFDKTPQEQAEWFLAYLSCPYPIIAFADVETLAASVLGVPFGSSEAVYKKAISALAEKVSANKKAKISNTIHLEQFDMDVDAEAFLYGIRTASSATSNIIAFMSYVEAYSVHKSGMYSSPGFIAAVFGNPASNEFLKFYLWIAHLTNAGKPTLQQPWLSHGEFPENDIVLWWQYTWTRGIPGVPDLTCDGNKMSLKKGSPSEVFGNGGDIQPPQLPEKVYTDVANLRMRRVPNSDSLSTICGYTYRNQENHPEELVVNEKGEEWYKVTAYIAKWLTRT